jgi:WD40 repeat protein/DNA-binding SARP family transcriptional activator
MSVTGGLTGREPSVPYEIKVLGRVDLLIDGRAVPLGGSKQRAVLAMLALRANRTVSADELIDGLWGEDPPASAAKNVQLYVSRLRKALGANGAGARIATRGRGYELELPDDAVDAARFERLVERARNEAERGVAVDGAAHRALALWRGPPLADVADEPFAAPEIRRLEELHLRAVELEIEAELATGRHAEALGRLEALIAEHPLHERFHAQRMLALYRAGRQSEAIEAYRTAHRTLVEEIGSEPGPELRKLQDAVLRQDPALDPRLPPRELPRQLEGGSPLLAGRDRELRWLQKRWREAEAARCRVALVSGPPGIGKTRLAAELAAEAQRTGSEVLYSAGSGSPEAALGAIRAAAQSDLPTLVVLDDADDASPGVLEAAATLAATPRDEPALLLVLHRDERGPPAFADAVQRLVLRPLRVDAATEIAELYSPAEGVAIPPETLMAESDGVPLRVHRAASGWAQAQAAEQLQAAAGEAAVDQGGLRAARAKVAGGVADLQEARERTSLYLVAEPPDPTEPEICPFRGLAPFDSAHAEYFFGRERLVADLVARLVGCALIAVVGPSGSGKSSLVRAGLLPSLADAVLPGSERWRQVLMRPGEHPSAELARALARAGLHQADEGEPVGAALRSLRDEERLVLAVDQFEEIFTACREEHERVAFAEALAALADDAEQRVVVVLGVRGDFYGRCAEHPELGALISANTVLVGPMRRDELRRAIELPAKRAGLRIEPSLVSTLIGDVAEEPGGLPLLSTTLVELWEERSGRTLRRSSYERSGGISGAVARLAERAYQRLSPAQRERAQAILLRLTDAEQPAPVRRRVPLAELETDRDEDAAAALGVLTESRLVTVDEGTVEVAHEALLREWPRLRAWLAEDIEGRRLHQHLIQAAAEWAAAGRDPGELYRGARLASTLEWAASRDPQLNELERDFLGASKEAAEREAERQRRTNRRLRTLLAGVGALLAAAVIAGLIAISERQDARDAATAEAAQRLGAQALSEDRLDRALRLAAAGLALDDSVATRSNLLSTLLRSPATGVLRGDDDSVWNLALSPDGRTLATGDQNGTVILFDTATGTRIGDPYQAPYDADQLAFDRRGNTLAVAGSRLRSGYLQFVDVGTQRLRRSAPLGKYPGGALSFGTAFAYAPDGKSLVVEYLGDETAGPRPVFLRRFDARTGERLGAVVRVAPSGGGGRLIATPDGRHLLLSTPHSTYAIDEATLDVTRRYPAGSAVAGVSPNGRTLALGGGDGTVRLLDLRSGRVQRLVGRHDAGVFSAGFSPGGSTLATTGDDGKVIVWDVRAGAERETFEGHSGRVWTEAFSPDGRSLYTASDDGSVIVWDTTGLRGLGKGFRTELVNREAEDFPPGLALSPDGRTIAVGRLDGAVELIDARTLRRTGGFDALHGPQALALEFSPDGNTLAVGGGEGALGLFDARSGEPIGPPIGVRSRVNSHKVQASVGNIQALSLSPDGRLLGTASVDGVVRVWDVGSGAQAAPPMHLKEFSLGLDFSPDGSELAVPTGYEPFGASENSKSGIDVRDWRSGRRVAFLPMDNVREATFSPDGSLLVGGQLDGTATIWSTEDWTRARQLAGHSGFVLKAAFSPDGRTLATSGSDGTVILWDVASGERIGSALPGDANRWVSAAFSPDGKHLFAVYDNGRAIRWEVDPAAWAHRACTVAGGGLTPDEWDAAVPGQDYVSICPSG